jgi:hypothetical protein
VHYIPQVALRIYLRFANGRVSRPEEDHPRSHELQKEIHALEHGHKDVVPVGYRGMEELEEPYPSENPTPEDFFRQLKKNFDEYSHSMVEEYEKVLLIYYK